MKPQDARWTNTGNGWLLEGEAGVGKTEVAKALAAVLDTRLIRLQCYEGLDATTAIYEWNYQRQLLAIKASERENVSAAQAEAHVFSERYLLRHTAKRNPPPVLARSPRRVLGG